jgi:hypothetical protein
VDATHLKCVGATGEVWRIHCVYSLLSQQLRQVVVSSSQVAEQLKHFVLQAGAIYVHDSGYGYRDRVAQSLQAGAYTVTAFYPGSFPLQDEHARSFELIGWLKRQRARAGKGCSTSAFFCHEENIYPIRVIALRRSHEQTQQMQRRKREKASKKQKGIHSETLYLAGWLLLLTSLPATDWSAAEVLSLYRTRWHIELLFKRIKELLSQHRLRAHTQQSALASVYAIVVSWLMQQEVASEMRSVLWQVYAELQEDHSRMSEAPSQVLEQEEAAISQWQVQSWSVDLLRHQVRGSWTRQRLLGCLPLLKRHLTERRRQRPHRWQQAYHWLAGPQSRTDPSRRPARRARTTARD